MNIVKIFHADHGVSMSTMQEMIDTIQPEGFFLRTVELPEGTPPVLNNLWGPACGDEPVLDCEAEWRVRDASDKFRQMTRFVDRAPRSTNLVTIIGTVEGSEVVIYTAYGGPAAERVPSDPSLADDPEGRRTAEEFWATHALAAFSAEAGTLESLSSL